MGFCPTPSIWSNSWLLWQWKLKKRAVLFSESIHSRARRQFPYLSMYSSTSRPLSIYSMFPNYKSSLFLSFIFLQNIKDMRRYLHIQMVFNSVKQSRSAFIFNHHRYRGIPVQKVDVASCVFWIKVANHYVGNELCWETYQGFDKSCSTKVSTSAQLQF